MTSVKKKKDKLHVFLIRAVRRKLQASRCVSIFTRDRSLIPPIEAWFPYKHENLLRALVLRCTIFGTWTWSNKILFGGVQHLPALIWTWPRVSILAPKWILRLTKKKKYIYISVDTWTERCYVICRKMKVMSRVTGRQKSRDQFVVLRYFTFVSSWCYFTYEQRTVSAGFALVVVVRDNRTVEFSFRDTVVP